MRKCKVLIANDKYQDATFHRWVDNAYVIEPSIMVGGTPGGQVSYTDALVEYEDGVCDLVKPYKIIFVSEENLVDELYERYKLAVEHMRSAHEKGVVDTL